MKGYQEALKSSMEWLAEKPDTFFLGQAVAVEGTSMYSTLRDIDINKRQEMPVIEDTQMGMTLGMALNGTVPISIYPRVDFLILAMSQLTNHVNRIKEYSGGEFVPKVIVRAGIGSTSPLDPQAQHKNNYTEAFKLMLDNFEVIQLDTTEQVLPAYQRAYLREDGKSTLIIEWGDGYDPNWEVK